MRGLLNRAPRGTVHVLILLTLFITLSLSCSDRQNESEPPAPAEPAAEAPAPGPAEPAAEPSSSETTEPAAEPASEQLPDVVARVGVHTITREQFLDEMAKVRQRLYIQRQGHAPIPNMTPLPELTNEQKAVLLNSMIEARIFGALAAKQDIVVTEEEIDQKLQDLKGRLVSESDYQRFLKESATSEEMLRDNIRQRLLMDKYAEKLINGTEFTDGQVEQAYERMKSGGSLRRPKSADIAHIFIAVENADDAPAKEKIDAVYQRLKAGEDFATLAKEVSEDTVSAPRGGVFEKVVRGQLGQSFDERLFTVPLNEVTEPFRSIKGWHVMKVLERHEPKDLTLEEATPSIENMLREAKKQEAMARVVTDARDTMDIEILVDWDLTQDKTKEVIPVPPDALVNPNALPESYRPQPQ